MAAPAPAIHLSPSDPPRDRDLSPHSTLAFLSASPHLSPLELADLVVALHDFSPPASSGNTCLKFASGQLLRVLNRDPSGWWDGETVKLTREGKVEEEENVEEVEGDDGVVRKGNRGWFPSNYVIQSGSGGGLESAEMDRVSLSLSSSDAAC